ncbi:MAG: DUF1508 domain-containing protein [Clostridiales bacterium]|nr:DUF1508 domain-containing protein [Clostridiales bacterium]
MSAFIDYCMKNPILTAILIGSAVLMLLLSGMILAMPDHEEKALDKKEEAQKAQEPKNEPIPTKETIPTKESIPTKVLLEKEAPLEKTEDEAQPIQPKKTTRKKKVAEEDIATPSAKEEKAAVEKLPKEKTATEEKPKRTRKPKVEEKTAPLVQKAETATEATGATAPIPEKKKTVKKTTKTQKNPTPDLKNENKEQDMLLDDLASVENVRDFYEEDETDRIAKYSGKWVICRVVTEEHSASHVKTDEEETYFFELHASNGEKLLSSEEYTTYNGALRGIQTHKTNILRGNFKIALSKKGDYIFKLLSGKNLILSMGENYPTKAACESAIESAKRFAKTAVIDENIQDHVVKVPVEDDSEILPLPDGYNGKWIISTRKDLDGADIYYFELFANNGEKLLSSEDYTTYVGAVNGIQTHKTNISEGNFRVTLTKRGDYIYKLLNKNGQLLCLGEHYKTKRRCLNAVESVKRFAVNAPVLTNIKL